jgi:polysaccharide deacetylase family protein (PEP-CTERM system associated)
MRNVVSIDLEDYFQVSAFDSVIPRSQWDKFASRVERNTQILLELFSRRQVKATFFVLGWIGERHPSLIRKICSLGHEVACHGYSHKLIYQQTPEEFREETRRAKALLEDLVGSPVCAYRAASYSITKRSLWALDILAEEGFLLDSSIFPIVHDRYGIPDACRRPFRIKLRNGMELTEFPISTIRMFGINLPVAGGGYFRLLPYQITKAAIQYLNRRERLPVIFYLHPWEFDPDQPVQPVKGLSRYRHYLNLHKTEPRFLQLLSDFTFSPLRAVADSMDFKSLTVQDLLPASRIS